ncbi:sulfotransferase 2B1-like [Protopterus annectens]|uniref:sulfotransferase 2B1-like n=1 Tax=Protopterus annectens TaxID=7888 RepID=UPI001CF96810|nr:sulfotransferase 2B1-like [Protopterus annectens]
MSAKSMRYEGILFPENSTDDAHLLFLRNEFQVKDDDIFNVTFPKSGTTWMLEILSLIQKNGDPTWSNTVPNYERVPWIEVKDLYENLEKYPSQRLICSHLPIQLFPKSIYNSKAKIIYTARYPKDVAVSLYYFYKISKFLEEPENFTETLELFLKGEVIYGSWFDHIKGWMEVKNKLNVFFITYEELLKDPRGSVVKICQFLGKELDTAAIDSVVRNTTFMAMAENKMSNFMLLPQTIMDQSTCRFMRKGISGDWKNHFTVAQSEHFDDVYQERMKGMKMKLPWE